MKKLLARGVAVVGAASISMTVFGGGVASADGFAGLTYAKASELVSKLKSTIVVAGVVGDRLARDECVVTRSQRDQKNNVLVFLNCNANVASATQSGNSVASPQGRQAKKDQDTADWINADAANCEMSEAIAKVCKDFCASHADMCSPTGQ